MNTPARPMGGPLRSSGSHSRQFQTRHERDRAAAYQEIPCRCLRPPDQTVRQRDRHDVSTGDQNHQRNPDLEGPEDEMLPKREA